MKYRQRHPHHCRQRDCSFVKSPSISVVAFPLPFQGRCTMGCVRQSPRVPMCISSVPMVLWVESILTLDLVQLGLALLPPSTRGVGQSLNHNDFIMTSSYLRSTPISPTPLTLTHTHMLHGQSKWPPGPASLVERASHSDPRQLTPPLPLPLPLTLFRPWSSTLEADSTPDRIPVVHL